MRKSKYMFVHIAFMCKEDGVYFEEVDVQRYEELFAQLFREDNVIKPIIKVTLGDQYEERKVVSHG